MDGPHVGLHVAGVVRTASGAPVGGATLEVWARQIDTCTGAFAVEAPTVSDSVGAFQRTLGTWNLPRDVCIWIAVTPAAGSALAPDTITFQPARLEFALGTLTVAIVLPSPAP